MATTKKKPVLVVTTVTRYEMADAAAAQFIAAAIRETGESYFDGWSHHDLGDAQETVTAKVES